MLLKHSYFVSRCLSFLVCTGVYKPSPKDEDSFNEENLSPTPADLCDCGGKLVDHGHRDLPFNEEMTTADYVVNDVKNAIDKIFELEKYSPVTSE